MFKVCTGGRPPAPCLTQWMLATVPILISIHVANAHLAPMKSRAAPRTQGIRRRRLAMTFLKCDRLSM